MVIARRIYSQILSFWTNVNNAGRNIECIEKTWVPLQIRKTILSHALGPFNLLSFHLILFHNIANVVWSLIVTCDIHERREHVFLLAALVPSRKDQALQKLFTNICIYMMSSSLDRDRQGMCVCLAQFCCC